MLRHNLSSLHAGFQLWINLPKKHKMVKPRCVPAVYLMEHRVAGAFTPIEGWNILAYQW